MTDKITVRDAVRQRITGLCEVRGITYNKMATICGLTQSTVNNIINTGSKNPTLSTIAKICDGLDISVREFFDDDLFDDTEQEIV